MRGQQEGAEGQLEGCEGQPKGSDCQPEGSDSQLEGSESQPEGSEGHPVGAEGKPGGTYGSTYVWNISLFYRTSQGCCPKKGHEFCSFTSSFITGTASGTSMRPALPFKTFQTNIHFKVASLMDIPELQH